MQNQQKTDMVIEVVNDIRKENNNRAQKILDQIEDKLSITDFHQDDCSILIAIRVRVGTDILSHGGCTHYQSSGIHDESDVVLLSKYIDSLEVTNQDE